jgi:hypothetical protein
VKQVWTSTHAINISKSWYCIMRAAAGMTPSANGMWIALGLTHLSPWVLIGAWQNLVHDNKPLLYQVLYCKIVVIYHWDQSNFETIM